TSSNAHATAPCRGSKRCAGRRNGVGASGDSLRNAEGDVSGGPDISVHSNSIGRSSRGVERNTALPTSVAVIIARNGTQTGHGGTNVNTEHSIKCAAERVHSHGSRRRRRPEPPNRFTAADACVRWLSRLFGRTHI